MTFQSLGEFTNFGIKENSTILGVSAWRPRILPSNDTGAETVSERTFADGELVDDASMEKIFITVADQGIFIYSMDDRKCRHSMSIKRNAQPLTSPASYDDVSNSFFVVSKYNTILRWQNDNFDAFTCQQQIHSIHCVSDESLSHLVVVFADGSISLFNTLSDSFTIEERHKKSSKTTVSKAFVYFSQGKLHASMLVVEDNKLYLRYFTFKKKQFDCSDDILVGPNDSLVTCAFHPASSLFSIYFPTTSSWIAFRQAQRLFSMTLPQTYSSLLCLNDQMIAFVTNKDELAHIDIYEVCYQTLQSSLTTTLPVQSSSSSPVLSAIHMASLQFNGPRSPSTLAIFSHATIHLVQYDVSPVLLSSVVNKGFPSSPAQITMPFLNQLKVKELITPQELKERKWLLSLGCSISLSPSSDGTSTAHLATSTEKASLLSSENTNEAKESDHINTRKSKTSKTLKDKKQDASSKKQKTEVSGASDTQITSSSTPNTVSVDDFTRRFFRYIKSRLRKENAHKESPSETTDTIVTAENTSTNESHSKHLPTQSSNEAATVVPPSSLRKKRRGKRGKDSKSQHALLEDSQSDAGKLPPSHSSFTDHRSERAEQLDVWFLSPACLHQVMLCVMRHLSLGVVPSDVLLYLLRSSNVSLSRYPTLISTLITLEQGELLEAVLQYSLDVSESELCDIIVWLLNHRLTANPNKTDYRRLVLAMNYPFNEIEMMSALRSRFANTDASLQFLVHFLLLLAQDLYGHVAESSPLAQLIRYQSSVSKSTRAIISSHSLTAWTTVVLDAGCTQCILHPTLHSDLMALGAIYSEAQSVAMELQTLHATLSALMTQKVLPVAQQAPYSIDILPW